MRADFITNSGIVMKNKNPEKFSGFVIADKKL
jgi:hypothetical protein